MADDINVGVKVNLDKLKALQKQINTLSTTQRTANSKLVTQQKQIDKLEKRSLRSKKGLNAADKSRLSTLRRSNAQLNKNIATRKQNIAVLKAEQAQTKASVASTQSRADALGNLSKPALRYALYDVSNSLRRVATASAALAAVPIGFAIKYEREFANVVRTSELAARSSEDVKNQLLGDLRDIAQATPISWTDITDIATLAGQLGIATDLIANFTENVAKFSATTDLTVDAAATGFGRLNQLIDGVDGNFEALGSAILAVGVDSVATESQIVNVATNIASMGNLAGLTAADIIGLSGSLASLGIRPELARGNITRLFSNINKSIAESGYELGEYGRLTGRTAEEFASSWENEPTQVLRDFFAGLSKEGADAERTLRRLGITSVRDIPALLRLSQNSKEVNRLIALSNSAFAESSKVNEQYGIISETVAEQLKRLGQNFAILGAVAGEATTGPLSFFVGLLNDIVEGLTGFAETGVGQALSTTLIGLSAIVAVLTGFGFVLATAAAGFSGLLFAATSLGLSMTDLSIKSVLTGRVFGSLAAAAGIAEARVASFARTARLALGTLGILSAVLVAGGLIWGSYSKKVKQSQAIQEEVIGSSASLRDALDSDLETYNKTGDALRVLTTTRERDVKVKNFTTEANKQLLDSEDRLYASGTSANEQIKERIVLGEQFANQIKLQASQSKELLALFENPVLRKGFVDEFGDFSSFIDLAIGTPEEAQRRLTEIAAYRTSFGALDFAGEQGGGTEESIQTLRELVDGLQDGSYFMTEAASAQALFNEAQEEAAYRIAISKGEISQLSDELFGVINAEKKAADATQKFFAALASGEEDIDASSASFQDFVNSILATGDTRQSIADLTYAQEQLESKGLLTADMASILSSALMELKITAGLTNKELQSTPDHLNGILETSGYVVEAIRKGLGGEVPEAVNRASGSVKTLEDKFDELLDSIFSPVKAAQDAAQSIADLGEAYAELGEDALYASGEIQDAVSAILESSGSPQEAVANLNALYAQLANTVGSSTAPSLQFLRSTIDQVASSFGVAADAVAGATVDLDFFNLGVQQAQQEVRTLSDYAGDLESVISRAFDIRFASTFAIDNIAEAWFDLTSQVEDAQYAVEELAATQQDLGSDRALKEYFLSVAEAYSDTLRASQLRKEIADLDRQQAQNAREIAEAQQIAGGDLTTQGPGSRQNRAALLDLVRNYQDYITSLAESGASQEELSKATEEARREFIRQARELGFQEDVVLQYAEAFDDVSTAINRVPRNITVDANVNPALQALNELNAKLNDSINLARELNRVQGEPTPTQPTRPTQPTQTVTGSGTPLLSAGRFPVPSRTPVGDVIFGGAPRVTITARQIEFVNPRIAARRADSGFASGGYTGAGGKYQPAGIVHRGEYVVPSQHVNQSSGLPNANFLSQLQNGVPGYANGGFVGGGGMGDGAMMVELSPYDRKLLEDAGNVQLRVDGKVVASATNRSNFNEARRGSN